MSKLLSDYISYLTSKYPSLRDEKDLPPQLELVVSDKIVPLPRSIFDDAQSCIKKIYFYAHSDDYIKKLKAEISDKETEILNKSPDRQRSVLMAYDFHFSNGKLGLIEINTNASSYLLAEAIYRATNSDLFSDAVSQLKNSFIAEKKAFDGTSPKAVAIVDETPERQRQYIEFIMYKDIFKSWGWDAEIKDIADFNDRRFDLVYNRHTDFYFHNSSFLRDIYLNNVSCVTPNPREYLLLADKNRLRLFSGLHSAILSTLPVRSIAAEEFWQNKKKYVFKPHGLFGSKGVYKGSSISRTVFDRIVKEGNYLAQEYSPPGTFENFKFDLRFFAYQDNIQLACARLYKGQVTGFDTLGGGLARILFQN